MSRTYHPKFKELVANTYLYSDLTQVQIGDMYGVHHSLVATWSRKKDPHIYSIAKGSNRKLLMAQEILEAVPTMRSEELAERVGVNRTTIDRWYTKGKIDMVMECDICGEHTLTKYCKSCSDKGWNIYVNRMDITHEELIAMPTACEVCGATERLHVDHDHTTGKYRGVLCHHCNVALGMVKDDTARLKKLVKYLNSNKNNYKPERNIIKVLREKYADKLQNSQLQGVT